MSVFLLDVNVLLALSWPAHESHDSVQRWFRRNADSGWATCPFTQAGFVRIASNPAFSPEAVTPDEALAVLEDNLGHRHHRFWPDSLGCAAAFEICGARLAGHRQVTDAYLLGLAVHKGGKLATLDRALQSLADESHRASVETLAP